MDQFVFEVSIDLAAYQADKSVERILFDFLFCVARGKDQDRRLVPISPQAAGNFEAVDSWQHNIEDDRVELVEACHFQPSGAIVGDCGGMFLLLESLLEEFGHSLLVLND